MYYSFRNDSPLLAIIRHFSNEFDSRLFQEPIQWAFVPRLLRLASEQFVHKEALLKYIPHEYTARRRSRGASGPIPCEAGSAVRRRANRCAPGEGLGYTYHWFHTDLSRAYTAYAEVVHDEIMKCAGTLKTEMPAAGVAKGVAN
jgi:hypothetical protein